MAETEEERRGLHDPTEARGDGITDDTDAIQRGGWWPKRGEPYTSPTHDRSEDAATQGDSQ